MNTQTQHPRPIAYSYVRFSTTQQELGDSLRRQVSMAEEYCKKHNLDLHPVSYRDLGVSAFKRKNVEKGALAAFIDAVKQGIITKGSFLVIEQFDRLSRADVDVALRLLLDLVHSGVTLITLVDEKVWDREAVKDIGNLILAIVFMSRANNESASKARRLADAWGEKKKAAALSGKIVTRECPRWLKVNDEKTAFVVLEEKIKSIKKVFEMRLGGYGVSSIVSRANKEGWSVPGKTPVRKTGETQGDFEERMGVETWHTSLVGRLLKNRALIGEYQPYKSDAGEGHRVPSGEPIPNYYPAVLDEQTFLRAQAVAERKGEFPGRRDVSLKNWLQGLLNCTCGKSFVRKNKDSKAQPGYARYYCSGRTRRVSDCPGASASEIENAVLMVVSTVAPQFFEGTARVDELKANTDILQLDLSSAKAARDRFVDAIATSKTPIPALVQRLSVAQSDVERIDKELSAARAELADLAGDFESVFENIMREVKNIENLDARARLREDLGRIIEKVVVHQADGYIRVKLRGVEVPLVHPLRLNASLPGIFSVDPYPTAAGELLDA